MEFELISFRKSEAILESALLNRATDDYHAYKINELFGLSIVDYINLPKLDQIHLNNKAKEYITKLDAASAAAAKEINKTIQ